VRHDRSPRRRFRVRLDWDECGASVTPPQRETHWCAAAEFPMRRRARFMDPQRRTRRGRKAISARDVKRMSEMTAPRGRLRRYWSFLDNTARSRARNFMECSIGPIRTSCPAGTVGHRLRSAVDR
jgi:hypothetical protein